MTTFRKSESLTGKIRVEHLFREGEKMVVWPFRVTYIHEPSNEQTRVLIIAPKALFKHAVDRNRLKRRMREAYRLNKEQIQNKGWHIAFRYIDKQQQPFSVIHKAMCKAIDKMLQC